MFVRRALSPCAVLFLFTASTLAQTAPSTTEGRPQVFTVPRPAIPADPLELASGATKVLDTPQERTTMLTLLERARQNSDLWGPGRPYVLKIKFDSSGTALYSGSGEMTQVWMTPARWRFDAQIGSFTQTRLFTGGRAYDERSNNFIPMRLQMVRNVVLWPINIGPRPLVRVAAGRLGQTDLLCGLFSSGMNDPAEMSSVPGRRWVEVEYCVEPSTGLLRVYSEAPGIYAVYDYAEPLEFNGHVLPRSISVTEAGQNVLNVRLESIAEPAPADIAQLTPSPSLASAGPGHALSLPIRFPQFTAAPASYKGDVHPVIIHAILDSDGRAIDQEPLQTSDSALTEAAMDLVRNRNFAATLGTGNRRFARLQREVFIDVKFSVPVQAAASPASKP